MSHHAATRREFLKRTSLACSGALVAPYFVPATSLGYGAVAPSERIVMGAIGTGGMGKHDMKTFMDFPDVQMVAICDVDANHRREALEIVNQKYGNQDCTPYRDFRDLVARTDVDAVTVTTPDHWHALCSIAAANARKDIYCEKPLANSVGEGRAICEAVKKNDRILQTGSHERSGSNARFAAELVRNGRIGKLQSIQINLPCDDGHHMQVRECVNVPPTMPIPEGFDYDFWLGHTRAVDYTEKRCHFWWRFILSCGGGEMTDRGAHVIDLAQLCAGFDDTGPVEIEAAGSASTTSLYDAFMDYKFVNRFANGVVMNGASEGPRGLKLQGSDGWIFIHVHGGKLEAEPASLLEEKIGENEIQLGRSPGHQRNFADCVKSRQQPFAHAEIGHRTASICHLNNIAMRLGRKLKWDPATEQVQDDAEANQLLTPNMRSPWQI